MLYDRWRQIVHSRPNQLALQDLVSRSRWSFKQLAGAAEVPRAEGRRCVFPSGSSVDFVVEVLRAWRLEEVVCPLEPGQAAPDIGAGLPPEVVHLKTTSASTGAPRLVAFTAAQLLADADNIVRSMKLKPEWANLGVISLAHSYGFSNLVLPLLLHGIPLILAGSALPEAIRRGIEGQGQVTLAAVPALWRTWLDTGCLTPNVQLAISAGAPLPLELEQAMYADHAIKIHNFYGSTECGGIAYDATDTPRRDPACAGAPLESVEIQVGQDDCLEIRGAAVGLNYWPEPNARLGDGIFRTSDVGELSGGRVYLRGRDSDRINVAGRKVLPEAIERVLASHPKVRACLAFGVPGADLQRGETIVAVVARAGDVPSESLKQYTMSHLPAWQVPRDWWFVESLEANHRGKLSRAEWRKRYLDKSPRRVRRSE